MMETSGSAFLPPARPSFPACSLVLAGAGSCRACPACSSSPFSLLGGPGHPPATRTWDAIPISRSQFHLTPVREPSWHCQMQISAIKNWKKKKKDTQDLADMGFGEQKMEGKPRFSPWPGFWERPSFGSGEVKRSCEHPARRYPQGSFFFFFGKNLLILE